MVKKGLCHLVCHNRCCVILSHIRLGVGATFWDD